MRREERVAAEPGRGDTGITRRADFPSRPSSASSVPWLDRAWAAQGTWGGGGCRAGGLGMWHRGVSSVAVRGSRSWPANFSGGRNRVVRCGLESECFAPAGCDSHMHANFFPWWWWRWWGDDLGSVLEDFSVSAS